METPGGKKDSSEALESVVSNSRFDDSSYRRYELATEEGKKSNERFKKTWRGKKRLSTYNRFLCEKKSLLPSAPPEKAKRGGRKSRSHDRHTKEVLKAQDSPKQFFFKGFCRFLSRYVKSATTVDNKQTKEKMISLAACSFINHKLAHDFLHLPPPPFLPGLEARGGGGRWGPGASRGKREKRRGASVRT